MTPLERRYRWLLRAYPAWYRRDRGEEMLGTLLEASQSGRWPSLRDGRALVLGGFRVRAGQNQRLTTAANLRLAVLLGAALALLWFIAGDLSGVILHWTHTYPSPAPRAGYWMASGVLALAAVAAAWFAPRPVVAALALAAAALWIYWGDRVMAIQPAGLLIMVAVLVFGRERLPRSWLWLAVVVFAMNMLQAAPLYFLFVPLIFVPWIVLGAVVLWAVVDARPAIAMAIYMASSYLVIRVLGYIGYGAGGLAPWKWYLPAVGAAVLAAAAVWRLRHQAVL